MTKMEPWEEHPDVWPTKAKFFAWLRGCFRKAIWNRYPGKVKVKNARCGKPPEDYTGRAKSGAYCSLTGEWVGKSALEVDHIVGEVSLRDWGDVETFCRHLCASEDNLQLVSKEAHKIKSYAERMGLTFAEAELEKEVIKFKKLSTAEQKYCLTNVCLLDKLPSNAKERAEAFRRYLKEE